MAHRRKIHISKTRVRHHVRRIAEYGAEEIDRFREHVHNAHAAQQRSIHKRAARLPPEAQEFLADEIAELDTVSQLADQLSLVALYRVVELTTARILAHEFGTGAAGNASAFRKVKDLLKQKGVDLATVPHYRAINELRLLNNAIKHKGRVTEELAKEYSRWKVGGELTKLDKAYARLRPKIPAYILRLAERMKLRYK
jgi:biotin operon repressor